MEHIGLNTFGGVEEILRTTYIDNGALFAEIDAFQYIKKDTAGVPIIQGIVGFMIITHGQMNINIDHVDMVATSSENNLLLLRASSSVYSIDISQDFKGSMLVLSSQFIYRHMGFIGFIFKEGRDIKNYERLLVTLDNYEKQILVESFGRVKFNLTYSSHKFYHEKVAISIIEGSLDVINLVVHKSDNIDVHGRVSRRDYICRQFVDMLREYCKKEHEVGFYADKLCITPQYLTKILKQVFGMSATKMISSAIMGEAVKLLRRPENNIAQVSDELNFADQASFSKFFRKHVGVSPTSYRRNHK